jgi:hypothetical protein
MLLKLINIFKTKSDLLDLVEEQSTRIQELEAKVESISKVNMASIISSKYLDDRMVDHNRRLVRKIEKLENEKDFIKQELRSLLENN